MVISHPKVQREALAEDVFVYVALGASREIAEAWSSAFKADMEANRAAPVLYTVHDMQKSSTTAFGIDQTVKIVHAIPPHQILYGGVVLPPGLLERLIRGVVEKAAWGIPRERLHYRFFQTRQEAIAWVLHERELRSASS